MRIHLYIRVSTDAQAEKGFSIPTQIVACERKAMDLGATEIVRHIDDGYSGGTLERPGLTALREAVRHKQVDVIICYAVDRLFRGEPYYQHLLMREFKMAKVKVTFIMTPYEETNAGELFFSVLGAIAEFERQTIKERTLRGKRGKAQSGKIVMNTHPTGYDYDKERSMYVPNEHAEVVKMLFTLAADGKSISFIVRQLNRERVSAPKGKFWHAGTVSRILRNPMYRGEARQFREIRKKVDGKWITEIRDEVDWITVPCPPLVSQELFDRAQSSVAENKRFSPRNTQRTYLLQHIARCGICGRSMTISQRGKQIDYYLCASHGLYSVTGQEHCGSRGIKAKLLDDTVWEFLASLVNDPGKLREQLAATEVPTQLTHGLSELRKQETDLVERQKKTMGFFSKGQIDSETAEDALKEIKKGLSEVRKRIQDINRVSSIRSVDDRVASFMAAMENPENQRDVCRTVLEAVYVKRTDNNKGRYAKAELDIRIIPK